jgi:hypothetical protein
MLDRKHRMLYMLGEAAGVLALLFMLYAIAWIAGAEIIDQIKALI